MSAFGITFVVGVLSWLIARVTRVFNPLPYPFDNPWLSWTTIIFYLLFFGATVALIVQIGMML